jgi:IMP dehydrogenase
MIIKRALAYDDVLLMPDYSEVLPRECNTKTLLCQGIELNVPFISSPMDTVTEADMAIAMSLHGGVGVIHKGMTIEEQIKQIERVKRWMNFVIPNPVTVMPGDHVSHLKELADKHGFSTFPVIEDDGSLYGIVTSKDIRLFPDANWVYDVAKRDAVSIKEYATEDEVLNVFAKNRVAKVPVVDKNNKCVGLITLTDIEKRADYPLATLDANGRLMVGAAVNVSDTIERTKALYAAGCDFIIVDSAHGDSKGVLNAVRKTVALDLIPVIGGNVSTRGGAERLVAAGAAAVRVGQGPSGICSTRIVSGCGIPQLTAVMDAVEGAGNIPVIADGGIKYSGDIVKALAAGARTVMIGGLFAGTKESPGKEVVLNGRIYKEYRGMGSLGAIKDHGGERYGMSKDEIISPEGVEGRVPYKGELGPYFAQLVAGLKKGMGYTGSTTLEDLREAHFVEITNSGLKESHAHDILMISGAPNYDGPN